MFHPHARFYLSASWVCLALVVFLLIGVHSTTAVVLLLVAATAPPLLMMALWNDGSSSSESIGAIMNPADKARTNR